MQTFKAYSVVVVPFPFTDKDTTKKRPALVISQATYQQHTGHCILAMITSAKQSQWKYDLPIADFESAGLPGASVIRAKFFTLDDRLIIGKLGELSTRDMEAVKKSWHPFLLP